MDTELLKEFSAPIKSTESTSSTSNTEEKVTAEIPASASEPEHASQSGPTTAVTTIPEPVIMTPSQPSKLGSEESPAVKVIPTQNTVASQNTNPAKLRTDSVSSTDPATTAAWKKSTMLAENQIIDTTTIVTESELPSTLINTELDQRNAAIQGKENDKEDMPKRKTKGKKKMNSKARTNGAAGQGSSKVEEKVVGEVEGGVTDTPEVAEEVSEAKELVEDSVKPEIESGKEVEVKDSSSRSETAEPTIDTPEAKKGIEESSEKESTVTEVAQEVDLPASKVEAKVESKESIPEVDEEVHSTAEVCIKSEEHQATTSKASAPVQETPLSEPAPEASKEELISTVPHVKAEESKPAVPVATSQASNTEVKAVEKVPAQEPVAVAKEEAHSAVPEVKKPVETPTTVSKPVNTATPKEIVLEIKKELVSPPTEDKKTSDSEVIETKSTSSTSTKVKETSIPETDTKEKVTTVTQKDVTEASLVEPITSETPTTIGATTSTSTITESKETTTPESKTTEESVTVVTEATAEIKHDHEEPSLIVKAEHVIEYIGEEIVNGVEETYEAVKNNPELIAEGALAVVVGAASLVQPELIAGEAALLAKMASDAAKKGGITIVQDTAKKVVHAIADDISADKDLDGVKDAEEKKVDAEGNEIKPAESELPKDETAKAEEKVVSEAASKDDTKPASPAEKSPEAEATKSTPTPETKDSSPATPKSGDKTIVIEVAQPPKSESAKPEESKTAPKQEASVIQKSIDPSPVPTTTPPTPIQQQEEMVTVPKQSLDHLHQKLDAMHEALEQITKTLALHLPPAVPIAPQTTLVDAVPEIIPGSPAQELAVSSPVVVVDESSAEEPVKPAEESTSGGSTEAAVEETPKPIEETPKTAETPAKKSHKKRGSVFSFLWPFGSTASDTASAKEIPDPTPVKVADPVVQEEGEASKSPVVKNVVKGKGDATVSVSVAEGGGGEVGNVA